MGRRSRRRRGENPKAKPAERPALGRQVAGWAVGLLYTALAFSPIPVVLYLLVEEGLSGNQSAWTWTAAYVVGYIVFVSIGFTLHTRWKAASDDKGATEAAQSDRNGAQSRDNEGNSEKRTGRTGEK